MSRTYPYTLLDPTRNFTLLVRADVPDSRQPAVASRLMALEKQAEQVGFFTCGNEGVCLRMAGGEFCGNAAMSAAALYAEICDAQTDTVAVHVLGVETTVRVQVCRTAPGAYNAAVQMPQPTAIERRKLPDGTERSIVFFPGIAHVIAEQPMERETVERLAPQWCAFLQAQALGVMQFDRTQNRLTPLVYVPQADTLFWENSCASGTAAVGYFLHAQSAAAMDAAICQPGGTLRVTTDADGALYLHGSVQILHHGQACF